MNMHAKKQGSQLHMMTNIHSKGHDSTSHTIRAMRLTRLLDGQTNRLSYERALVE